MESRAPRHSAGSSLEGVPAGGEDFRNDRSHVLVARAMVDETGTQGKASGNGSVREVDAAALDEPLQDRGVEPVQVTGDPGAVAEADGAQIRGRQQLEFCCTADGPRELAGVSQVGADGRPKRFGAVI